MTLYQKLAYCWAYCFASALQIILIDMGSHIYCLLSQKGVEEDIWADITAQSMPLSRSTENTCDGEVEQ